MRVRHVLFAAAVSTALVALLAAGAAAHPSTWARGALNNVEGQAGQGRGAAATQGTRVHGNLLQVMRGTLYPASNVIFAAQSEDPGAIKPATPDASTSPNPLTSAYGGWTAVENAGIAIAEAANLLTIPGRQCANGKAAPVQNADWQMWIQELRDAGMATYKAAQAKNQDAILEAAGVVSDACQHCHDKYREVPNRC